MNPFFRKLERVRIACQIKIFAMNLKITIVISLKFRWLILNTRWLEISFKYANFKATTWLLVQNLLIFTKFKLKLLFGVVLKRVTLKLPPIHPQLNLFVEFLLRHPLVEVIPRILQFYISEQLLLSVSMKDLSKNLTLSYYSLFVLFFSRKAAPNFLKLPFSGPRLSPSVRT